MSRSCDRDVITGPALIPTLGPEAAVDYKGPSERKRKMIAMYKMSMAAKNEDDSEGKQAVLTLEKENLSQEDAQLKEEVQHGDITVQWKDGQITSLYTDAPEEDV
ncbi:unnamed protein product [Ranitomeya imitator]|uniref:Uncharacterized protein n=1 Tax=Ranitomeya imitator TaxID=111125 RepID=A0ABN9MD82_9NEOB|nr:unnamed protein product [Ranitomeya imitator]